MDGLRWLLLLCGVLVIAGVYIYSRKEQRGAGEKKAVDGDMRVAPTLGEPGESVDDESAADAPASPDIVLDPGGKDDVDKAAHTRQRPQKIVTMRLVAKNRGAFPGDELVLSLRGIGLRHGKFGIFHRYDGNDESRIVFSAASLVEPGSFELKNIKEQQIPGISMFMVLPGPLEAAEAFDLMMESARALSRSLNAEMLDESGSTLSIQRERYLREEIIQFQHSNLVA